jgi:hypothetical protein
MNAMMAKAKQVGRRIPIELLRRQAELEMRAYRRSSPRKYAAARLASLSRQYNALLEKFEQLQTKALRVRDPEREAKAQAALDMLGGDLAFLRAFLVELRKGARSSAGLGAAAEAVFPPWYAYLFTGWTGALLFPIGIAVGVSLIFLVVKGGKRLERALEGLGEAAKTAVIIIGVAGGVIAAIWAARVIRDVWAKPRTRKEIEQEEKEIERSRGRFGPGARKVAIPAST